MRKACRSKSSCRSFCSPGEQVDSIQLAAAVLCFASGGAIALSPGRDRERSFQEVLEMLEQSFRGAGIEQLSIVFENRDIPVGTLVDHQQQIEFRGATVSRATMEFPSRMLKLDHRLDDERDVEEGAPKINATPLLQFLHHLHEGDASMVEGVHRRAMHTADKFTKCQVAGNVGPQGNRIQKTSEKLLKLDLFAIRKDGSDDDILLPAVPRQKRFECGEKYDKTSRFFTPAELIERFAQRLRQIGLAACSDR